MKSFIYYFFGGIAIGIIGWAGLTYASQGYLPFFAPKAPEIPASAAFELLPEEYAFLETGYAKILNDHNPRAALSILREQTAINPRVLRSCHALVHSLGHEAYEKYKDFGEAMSYQNELCNSGYIHGVIEKHFTAESDIGSAMTNVCDSYVRGSFVRWQCTHGIGHGLMYYSNNDLPNTLALCDTLPDSLDQSVCRNGVFMENFNTDHKVHASSYLRDDDSFFPCGEQTEKHKSDCYLYAPTHYLTRHKNEYTKALDWCRGAVEKFIETCAQGVGSQAMKENISTPDLVETACESDEELRESCLRGMVELYAFHHGAIEPAEALCKILKGKNQAPCRERVLLLSALFR
jgi:hypothetical protein